MSLKIVSTAKQVWQTGSWDASQELALDSVYQGAEGKAVLEVMSILITAVTATDQEISMCHVMDQNCQDDFGS